MLVGLLGDGWHCTTRIGPFSYNDLMNMKSEAVLPLGRYVHPPAFGKPFGCILKHQELLEREIFIVPGLYGST